MKQNSLPALLGSIEGISQKLIEQLDKLCNIFARTYQKYNNSLTSADDIKAECYLSVLKHKDRFDANLSKSKDVFIYSYVLNDLKSYIRKAKYRISCTDYDAANYPLEVNKANSAVHDVYLLSDALEDRESKNYTLPDSLPIEPNEEKILSRRFVDKETYAQIAQDLGISTSGAYYQVRKILDKLRFNLK